MRGLLLLSAVVLSLASPMDPVAGTAGGPPINCRGGSCTRTRRRLYYEPLFDLPATGSTIGPRFVVRFKLREPVVPGSLQLELDTPDALADPASPHVVHFASHLEAVGVWHRALVGPLRRGVSRDPNITSVSNALGHAANLVNGQVYTAVLSYAVTYDTERKMAHHDNIYAGTCHLPQAAAVAHSAALQAPHMRVTEPPSLLSRDTQRNRDHMFADHMFAFAHRPACRSTYPAAHPRHATGGPGVPFYTHPHLIHPSGEGRRRSVGSLANCSAAVCEQRGWRCSDPHPARRQRPRICAAFLPAHWGSTRPQCTPRVLPAACGGPG